MAKTLQVIHAASDNPDELIIAGEVADIRFAKGVGLSLLGSKLFVQLMDRAGGKICDQVEHRATIRELNWSHLDLKEIEDTIRELQRSIVELTVDTARGKVRKSGPILSDVERDLDAATGEISWEFSKTFRSVVRNSKHWAAVSSRAIMAMDSKYAVWLYQLLALRAGRKQVAHEFELAELRERLGATAPSMRRWQSFKQRVLDPAVAEINHLTGIMISWEKIKKGRMVVGVRFTARPKVDDEIQEAEAELARTRVGRKERREGIVESIEARRDEIRDEIKKSLASVENTLADLDDNINF